MTLAELLDVRRQLAARLKQIEDAARPLRAQLEDLDRQLIARVQTLADAIEGDARAQRISTETDKGLRLQAVEPTLRHVLTDAKSGAVALNEPAAAGKRRVGERLSGQIVNALRALGRPVSRNELFEYMTTNGITVPGKDPKANLSAHLSYSEAVVRNEAGKWQLRDLDAHERQTPA